MTIAQLTAMSREGENVAELLDAANRLHELLDSKALQLIARNI